MVASLVGQMVYQRAAKSVISMVQKMADPKAD